MADQVYLERDGDIATVILNQPDRFNVMNKGMFQGLTKVLRNVTQIHRFDAS